MQGHLPGTGGMSCLGQGLEEPHPAGKEAGFRPQEELLFRQALPDAFKSRFTTLVMHQGIACVSALGLLS